MSSAAAKLRARLEEMKAKKAATAPALSTASNGAVADSAVPDAAAPAAVAPVTAPPPQQPAPAAAAIAAPTAAPEAVQPKRTGPPAWLDVAPHSVPPKCYRSEARPSASDFAAGYLARVASGEKKRARSPGSLDPALPVTRALDDPERYERQGVISQGVYGVVSRGIDRKTGRQHALKAIKGNWLLEGRAGLPEYMLRELDIGARVRHPHVVRIDAAAIVRLAEPTSASRDARPGGTSAGAAARTRLLLVSEFAGHTLRSDIARGPMCPGSAKFLLRQLLDALRFLHHRCVAHRDLKPSNVLVDTSGTLKVCDLGLARSATARQRGLTTAVVTLPYRAPELLLGAGAYDAAAVDMWSVGCILAEMLIGGCLFRSDTEAAHLTHICRLVGPPTNARFPGFYALAAAPSALTAATLPHLDCPGAEQRTSALTGQRYTTAPVLRAELTAMQPGIPEEALDLVEQLLQWDPKARPTAAEALASPFFSRGEAASPVFLERRPHHHKHPKQGEPDSSSPDTQVQSESVGVVPQAQDDDDDDE